MSNQIGEDLDSEILGQDFRSDEKMNTQRAVDDENF